VQARVAGGRRGEVVRGSEGHLCGGAAERLGDEVEVVVLCYRDAAVARLVETSSSGQRSSGLSPVLSSLAKSGKLDRDGAGESGIRRCEKWLDTLPLVAGRGAAWLAR
jgi:hypothetical protein